MLEERSAHHVDVSFALFVTPLPVWSGAGPEYPVYHLMTKDGGPL